MSVPFQTLAALYKNDILDTQVNCYHYLDYVCNPHIKLLHKNFNLWSFLGGFVFVNESYKTSKNKGYVDFFHSDLFERIQVFFSKGHQRTSS